MNKEKLIERINYLLEENRTFKQEAKVDGRKLTYHYVDGKLALLCSLRDEIERGDFDNTAEELAIELAMKINNKIDGIAKAKEYNLSKEADKASTGSIFSGDSIPDTLMGEKETDLESLLGNVDGYDAIMLSQKDSRRLRDFIRLVENNADRLILRITQLLDTELETNSAQELLSQIDEIKQSLEGLRNKEIK